VVDATTGDLLIMTVGYNSGASVWETVFLRLPAAGGSQTVWKTLADFQGNAAAVPENGTEIYISESGSIRVYSLADGSELPNAGFIKVQDSCDPNVGTRQIQERSISFDRNGYLWLVDENCKRLNQYDVSTAPWTFLSYYGSNNNVNMKGSVAVRPDGVAFNANNSSDYPFVRVMCPGPLAGEGVYPRVASRRS
jgi:hypothetical protein